MKSYNTVHTGGQGEIVEKKSRFIANVFPISTEEEAGARIEEIRKRYWDARHNCWAYVLGGNPPTERMSDGKMLPPSSSLISKSADGKSRSRKR